MSAWNRAKVDEFHARDFLIAIGKDSRGVGIVAQMEIFCFLCAGKNHLVHRGFRMEFTGKT